MQKGWSCTKQLEMRLTRYRGHARLACASGRALVSCIIVTTYYNGCSRFAGADGLIDG